jgi:c-di-GMP-binding flagellar brake protein YcgR
MNQPVQIVVDGHVVRSRVIRHVKDEVYIDALSDEDVDRTPRIGQTVWIRWADDDTLYQQSAVIRDILDPVPIMVAVLRDRSTVIEFRQAPRIRVGLPLEYGLKRPGSEIFVTTTMDISSQGLKFPAAQKYWLGLELRCRIRVDKRVMDLSARVVRVSNKPKEIRGRMSWETAVQFVTLLPDDRKWLEQYVDRYHEKHRHGGFPLR